MILNRAVHRTIYGYSRIVNRTKSDSPGTATGYYCIHTVWSYYGWYELYSESNKRQGSSFDAAVCWFNLLLTWRTDYDELLSDLSMPICVPYKYGHTFSLSPLWQYSYRIRITATVQAVNTAMVDSPMWWWREHQLNRPKLKTESFVDHIPNLRR